MWVWRIQSCSWDGRSWWGQAGLSPGLVAPKEMLSVPAAEGEPLAVGAGLLEAAVLVVRGFFKLCLWEGSTKDIGQA